MCAESPEVSLFWAKKLFSDFVTARKRSLRRLCFYTCLSVHGGGVSRPIPRGKVEGSGWGGSPGPHGGEVEGSGWEGGFSRPTPGGVSRPTPRGVSRPTPRGECPGPGRGGVHPSMH